MKKSKKDTARGWQSSVFIGELLEQLNKMAASASKVDQKMEKYLNSGMSVIEAKELLFYDGFDEDVVESCASRYDDDSMFLPMQQWGFEIKNKKGKKLTHVDMGITLEAQTEEEARDQLEEINDSHGDEEGYKIKKVFKIKR